MSIRTTSREILRNYPRTIRLGYCEAPYLFSGNDALMHTEGMYGWNSHVYIFPELRAAVSTGYRPFGKIEAPRDVVEYFEQMAATAVKNGENNLRQIQMSFVKTILDQLG